MPINDHPLLPQAAAKPLTAAPGHTTPSSHHRRSIRLRGYDYSQAGAYSVTICTQGRERVLGEVKGEGVELTPIGRMVDTVWLTLPDRFPYVDLDAYVIMPNHFHGILLIHARPIDSPSAKCLGDIVRAFKSITTHEYVLGVRNLGWPPFPGRFWQRNYYERIIRSESSLEAIRRYISSNPTNWTLDLENR